ILLVDLAVVLVFAGIGRDSHGEGLAPTQILTVAWPFLVATGVGWALAYTLSQVRSTNPETHTFHPLRLFPDGTIIWVATVAVGMVARALLTTRGIAPSFVVVAAVFLGLFLLGWRAVATRLLARAARSDVAEERAGHL
ncbi:DUF3054 domain-containing protein, partial [Tsukamurella sp. 8F]|uniref:DUF3054 domain-containing protein n=2 Tax=unclassified Tsukamurella TaxID=2633480 RepID=UPI0031BA19FF